MTATKPKIKNLFPKLARGGYTARLIFTDEVRGERYFDREWDVRGYAEPGRFNLGCMVDFRGCTILAQQSATTIGADIRPGDRISVTVTRWNRRGRWNGGGRLITIRAVRVDAENGTTEIEYE